MVRKFFPNGRPQFLSRMSGLYPSPYRRSGVKIDSFTPATFTGSATVRFAETILLQRYLAVVCKASITKHEGYRFYRFDWFWFAPSLKTGNAPYYKSGVRSGLNNFSSYQNNWHKRRRLNFSLRKPYFLTSLCHFRVMISVEDTGWNRGRGAPGGRHAGGKCTRGYRASLPETKAPITTCRQRRLRRWPKR